MLDLRYSEVALLLNYAFFYAKQMLGTEKMSSLLLRINLSQIFTIYNLWALRKLSEDFQEDVLSEIILLYTRFSLSLLFH